MALDWPIKSSISHQGVKAVEPEVRKRMLPRFGGGRRCNLTKKTGNKGLEAADLSEKVDKLSFYHG